MHLTNTEALSEGMFNCIALWKMQKKMPLGVTSPMLISSIMLQWHEVWNQLAHLKSRAAVEAGDHSRLALNCLWFHTALQAWMGNKKHLPSQDEAEGEGARALIAPCDSATDLQPISWQLGRKQTLCVGGDGKQQLQVSWAVQHEGLFSKMIVEI